MEIANQLLHALLARRGEILLAVDAAKGLAHHAFHLGGGTLPARLVLLGAAHRLGIESEADRADVVAEVVGCLVDDVPLHVGAQLVGRLRGEELVEASEEGRLTDDHLLDILRLDALCGTELLEMDVGIIGLKLLERELVVVGLHVAELRLALGDESQGGLEAHDEVALLLGLLLGESEELEHIDDKLLVGVADVGRGLVVVEVVLSLAERQSALVDVEDVHLRVLLVGTPKPIPMGTP